MPLGALDLRRTVDSTPDSTPKILGMSHRFEMVRIDAGLHSAQMIQFQAIRNRTIDPLIGDSMCTSGAATGVEVPVAVAQSAMPNVASVRVGRPLRVEGVGFCHSVPFLWGIRHRHPRRAKGPVLDRPSR